MQENKTFIIDYLRALSGRSKPTATIQKYVADADLATHIVETEAAFPNYEIVADQIIAEQDLVVVRGRFRGLHKGSFAGIEPTGSTVSAGLIIIYRIENSRIV